MPADFYTTPSWKKTSLGTSIELVSSAPLESLAGESPILLIGGVHGDEPEGVRLAEDTLEWLKSETRKEQPLEPWIVIPCLNVDGFAKRTRVNGRGVDLNRNYPSRDWSPRFEKERYYPGAAPASEPEIQGVVELIEGQKFGFKPRIVIHCHSWQPCIVATGEPGGEAARLLSANSGYRVVPEIGYPTPGSLSGYGWRDNQIPIICIEEQENLEDLSSIWPRFSTAMAEIFRRKS